MVSTRASVVRPIFGTVSRLARVLHFFLGKHTMKKTLTAIAVLGAFAGSAMAADVQLYGLVDYGFAYQHADADVANQDATDSFKMNSGMNSGSRFGVKGTEELGNGLTVGFVLENGFDADTGSLTTDSKLFDRESQVYLKGNFGTLSMGRVGQLASANGTFSLLGRVSPFSSGWGDSVGQKYVMAQGYGRMDNTVTYVTPDFAGFKVHAQYSFEANSDQKHEGTSDANRYYGVAATYETGPLYLVAIVDSVNYGTEPFNGSKLANPADDQMTVTLGGSYDFGPAKLFASGQYFQHAAAVGQKFVDADSINKYGYNFGAVNGADGYGLALGVSAPVLGGTAKAHVGYLDAEGSDDSAQDITRWNVAVGYDYALSKRTSVYTAASYMKDDVNTTKFTGEPSMVEVMAGMIHRF